MFAGIQIITNADISNTVNHDVSGVVIAEYPINTGIPPEIPPSIMLLECLLFNNRLYITTLSNIPMNMNIAHNGLIVYAIINDNLARAQRNS